MAQYDSSFTGQHNDEYNERITNLLNTITEQQSIIINLTNRITTLENQNLNTRLSILENFKDNYSTSEIATNKIWINGKIIYRKIYELGSKVAGSYVLSHGISGITQFVTIRIIGKNGGNWYPICYSYDTSHLGWVFTNTSNIQYNIPFDSNPTYAILEYTK